MSESTALTLAFLEFHPQAAAKAIGDLQPGDAAAFLDGVPPRLCAPLVASAAPWMAAGWMELMKRVHAAAILKEMSFHDVTTVLRLVAPERRAEVLKELPTRTARNFMRSLSYPRGTVGAVMDHSVAVFEESNTVADGVKYFKSKRGRAASHLFVIDESKSFSGIVSAADLLRSASKVPLGEIMQTTMTPFQSRALVASLLDDPAWDHLTSLPVVGRKGNVTGILERTIVRKSLEGDEAELPAVGSDSILAQLAAGFIAVIPAIMRIVIEPGAAKPPLRAKGG